MIFVALFFLKFFLTRISAETNDEWMRFTLARRFNAPMIQLLQCSNSKSKLNRKLELKRKINETETQNSRSRVHCPFRSAVVAVFIFNQEKVKLLTKMVAKDKELISNI